MRLVHLASSVVAVVVLALGSPAFGQEQRDSEPDREWYGWQSAGLGVATGTLFVAGLASREDGVAWAGAISFALASPLSHIIRGQADRALGAFALNLGVPFAALMTFGVPAAFVGACGDGNGCVAYPMAIGMAVAMAIDAAALSWQDPPPRRFLSSNVAPFVAPSEEQVVFGVSWTG